jgi:putative PEP-CTERM system histidine kinase
MIALATPVHELVTPGTLLPLASAVCSGALAFGVLLRDRRSEVHWAFFAGMTMLLAESLFCWLSAGSGSPVEIFDWQQRRLFALAPLPGVWLVFSLTYARGNAREFLARWRVPIVLAFLGPAALLAFSHGRLLALHEDPTGKAWNLRLEPSGVAFFVLLLIGSVVVLMNLERTFRASVGTMRWRIKFMLLGVGVLFVARVYTTSEDLLFRGIDPSLDGLNSAAVLVAALLMLRSFSRTGHFDVDVYPSQSVLQGSLTVFLAGIYLLVVGALAQVVSYFGGGAGFNFRALVVLVSVVVLAVLLQSDRLRLQLRRFVSRHFQRPLYDYRTAWKKFTEGTVSCVEQKELSRSLVRLVAEMFQVLSVTIWLVNERKESLTLTASTSLPEAAGKNHGLEEVETSAVISHFLRHAEPVDIELSTESWAVALKQWHPSEFPDEGGNRVCIPMIGRGEILGLILLGDRVGGVAFSMQDFDLLKCVGDHAAASLLNVQLSEKLLQARELEAFQTMAAFFVHDLKNAGSTLGLMLQNLPVHFDDPVFRADTLRGIGKTVTHINRLISRLSLLRHELTIKSTTSDLNDVVAQALAGLEPGTGSVLVKDLQPLPPVRLDPEQMQKVVTNLVLNAIEAGTAQGQVRISTGHDHASVVLTVADHGCGMSADFLNHSLFRPFQTTKQGGLGIGMFQSRMIVEAHGGKITVASEAGRGTTFQVFLPMLKEAR